MATLIGSRRRLNCAVALVRFSNSITCAQTYAGGSRLLECANEVFAVRHAWCASASRHIPGLCTQPDACVGLFGTAIRATNHVRFISGQPVTCKAVLSGPNCEFHYGVLY